jgi:hypothetical protein
MPEFSNPAHVSVTPRGGGWTGLGLPLAAAGVVAGGSFIAANLMIITVMAAVLSAVTGGVTGSAVLVLRRHTVVGWASPRPVMAPAARALPVMAAPQVHVHFHGLSAADAAAVLAGPLPPGITAGEASWPSS